MHAEWQYLSRASARLAGALASLLSGSPPSGFVVVLPSAPASDFVESSGRVVSVGLLEELGEGPEGSLADCELSPQATTRKTHGRQTRPRFMGSRYGTVWNLCNTAVGAAKGTALSPRPSSITMADLKNVVSPPCAACGWGVAADAKWSPIVLDATFGAGTSHPRKGPLLNSGACMAIVSGRDKCGQAYQEWSACVDTACKDCAAADEGQCGEDAQAGESCRAQTEAVQADDACGADVTIYQTRCQAFQRTLCTTCGGEDENGNPDGSTKYFLELPLGAMCRSNPASTCNPRTTAPSSDVGGTQTIANLTVTELGQLCDWAAGRAGGYGCKVECSSDSSFETKANKSACMASLNECTATVIQYEDCHNALLADPCDLTAALQTTACQAMLDCL